jgi:hypothetical protein
MQGGIASNIKEVRSVACLLDKIEMIGLYFSYSYFPGQIFMTAQVATNRFLHGEPGVAGLRGKP